MFTAEDHISRSVFKQQYECDYKSFKMLGYIEKRIRFINVIFKKSLFYSDFINI